MIASHPLRVLAISLAVVAFNALPAAGQSEPYHILVTNDDGIRSPGIEQLAEALRGVGQVHVVAPCGQRSGASMSVALRDELELRPVERESGAIEHCVDTTPAGAALLAISSLAPEGGFDLVVSGINAGANVGTASHMSGTVGAAMMGAFYGIPAVAASLGARSMDFDYPARFVAQFVDELKRHPPVPGTVFSVNIPRATEAETAGVAVAPMGGIHLRFGFEEVPGESGNRRFSPRIGQETDFPEGSDSEALAQDMITITPLSFDWTSYSMIDELTSWGLSHEIGR